VLVRWETLAVAIVAVLGFGLSRATTRVADWFVMTDELLYERLAISVARSGSVLPHVHGELISNINQLYPLLLSLVYGNGDVAGSLDDAHLLNAFLMSSTAIPAFLLARAVLGRPLVAVAVAVLSVCVPWIVLSSFLLTEVAAYPAFVWAVLAITYAVARKQVAYDALAVLAIAIAVTARTQFLLLFGVLPVAVLAEAVLAELQAGARGFDTAHRALRALLRTRKPLLAFYSLAVAFLIALVAAGEGSELFGTYDAAANGLDVSARLLKLFAAHLAIMSLTFAVLPFLVGLAWMLARYRPSAPPQERAFAVVALTTVLAMTLEVASFNERFGQALVKDRYLFYIAPLVLVAFAAALVSKSLPRAALVVPTAVCALGFAWAPLPVYEKLNVDSPSATLNNTLLDVAGSTRWAHVLLACATVALAVVLVGGSLVVRRAALVWVLAALVLALPAQAVYAFDRLFAVHGTTGLPITDRQWSSAFGWIDRQFGTGPTVSIVPYPVNPGDYWAGASFWWSLEFWNEDIVDALTLDGSFTYTPSTFPTVDLGFDPHTGVANYTGGDYVALAASETRFDLAGRRAALNGNVRLLLPDKPWQASWLTSGLYEDGWTEAGRVARIRVFPEPGQKGALMRYVTIVAAPPGDDPDRQVTVVSNAGRWTGPVTADGLSRQFSLCVPAGGYADLRLSTPGVSTIDVTGRKGGVWVRQIGLADEKTPVAGCG
jgi:hypothetical protein